MEIDYRWIFGRLGFNEAVEQSCKLAVDKVMADVEFDCVYRFGGDMINMPKFDSAVIDRVLPPDADGNFQIVMRDNWLHPPFDLNQLIF